MFCRPHHSPGFPTGPTFLWGPDLVRTQMVATSSAADRMRRWLAVQDAARDAAALVGSECGELEDDGERPED